MPTDHLHQQFLTHLSRIEAPIAWAFRTVPCTDTRSDLAAEALGLTWRWYVALAQRGRRPDEFVTVLAQRCAQAVHAGRRLAGCARSGDVFSRAAIERAGAAARTLGHGALGREVADALVEPRRSTVPDLVAFRIDYPAWRRGLAPRVRRVLDLLALGEPTGAVAHRCGLTPGRVSQIRRELFESWSAFHNETQPVPTSRHTSPRNTPYHQPQSKELPCPQQP